MHKLPMTAKEAQQLVDNGHMTPETHAEAHSRGAFMDSPVQHFADGGEVQADPTAQIDPTTQLMNQKAAYYQTQGMSMGDAMAKAATDIQGTKDDATTQDATSQANFDQSMAALPTTPEQAQQMEALGGKPGIAGPATSPLQGAQVASIDPKSDVATAAGMMPQSGQPGAVEAGHMPVSALAVPTAPSADPATDQMTKDVNQVMGGMQQEQAGVKASFDAGAKQANETAGYIHQMREHMQAAQAQEQQMEAARQSEANAQYQKVQKAADDAAQAGKLDPNHFWDSKSTGQKIAAAIGIALGGIGGGLSGHGGNAAMDVINKAIDRDMDAQKFNAEQKQRAFGTQQSLYGMMRQKFGDERQAEAATQMAYYQSAEMQIRETAAKYQAPELQARAQQLIGQLQQKQGMLAQSIHASAYQAAAMRQLSGGGTMSGMAISMLPEKVQARLVPLDGGARHGIAYDEKAAGEVRGVSAAADNVHDIISQMRQLKEEGGKRIIPYGTLYAKSQALQSRLIPALNEMAGLKRLSEEDIKNLHKQIPDPGSWLSDKSDALLDGLEQSVHDRTQSYYKNNLEGYKPSTFKRTR